MESIDKEFGTAMGALFHQIITDLKVGAPLWEDFLSKASKLHTALKSTLSVISAYLDAFQKIADSATNAKGATKDIGTVLTRICLRHKAVEARLKTFTSALMECLVLPLHDKLEEWKKMVVNLDKDHAKEYKKVRADIKKRTADAQRWQKKARKIRAGMMTSGHVGGSHLSGVNSIGGNGGGGGVGGVSGGPTGTTSINEQRALSAANQELLRAADASQTDLKSRLAILQETEKTALKTVLVEERSRYCLFVACLKPVMSEEMAMCAELSHLEEIITQLDKHTQDPFSLPSSTEQMIAELKGAAEHGSHWALQTPPSSPSSLGSRKSSMCSLGSIHSSSSGSVASHSHQAGQFLQSPSRSIHQQQQQQEQMMQLSQQAHIRHRSLSQVAGNAAGPSNGGIRLSSVSSQDSGFTSQDTLVLRPTNSPPLCHALVQEVALASSSSGEGSGSSGSGSNSSTPCTPYPPGMGSTWPNLQETVQFDRGTVVGHHMNHSVAMVMNERPHTISTAYEKGHQRPALSVYTFQPLEQHVGSSSGSLDRSNNCITPTSEMTEYDTLRRCRDAKTGPVHLRNHHDYDHEEGVESQESLGLNSRPPLPQRCSSLERPVVPPQPPSCSSAKSKSHNNKKQNKKESAVDATTAAALPDFHMAAPDMIVPQPVYMNASELRCQQQQLGLNGDDLASNAIYTSIASCTIYDDSQACTTCHGHPDSWRMPPPKPAFLKRPASFSGGYADPGSNDWAGGIRSSGRMSNIKRSSIPSFATLHEVSNVDETGHPAHNDEVTPLAEGPSHLSAISHTTHVPPDEIDLAALPPPPDFLLDDQPNPINPTNSDSSSSKIIPERSLSVADAVKTLNEIRHQPASPGVVRRAQSLRSTSDTPDPRILLMQRQQQQQQQESSPPIIPLVGSGNKIGPGTTPKTNRGHGSNNTLLHHSSSMKNPSPKLTATQQLMMSRTLPKHMPSHADCGTEKADYSGQQKKLVSGLLSKSSFVQQLNAKLAAQQHQHQQNPNNSDPCSPSSIHHQHQQQQQQRLLRQPADHESLMDQIRRGTSLRRARSTSDRSSPHFRH